MSKSQKKEFKIIPKIIDRYIAREYLFSYLIAIVVVLSLRTLIDLFLQFDEFSEKADDTAFQVIASIINYYTPKLFEYYRDFSGMIVLLAAAFSLIRMSRQNELTAILASGISLKRVVAPIILLGFGLNMIMVVDQELILPHLADKLTRKPDEVQEARIVQIWNLRDKDNALISGQFNAQTNELTKFMVIQRNDSIMTGVIMAKAAKWDTDQKHWVLTKGKYRKPGVESNKSPVVLKYESDLTPEYLWLQRNSSFKSLMSKSELTQLILRRQLKPIDEAEAIGETYFRLSDPIINMVMLLMGLPMLISRDKRNPKSSIFLAIIGSGGCFIVTFACKLMVGTGLEPFMAAALPIIIFTPLSVLAVDSIQT